MGVTKITVEVVDAFVELIRLNAEQGNDEKANAGEDALHRLVLEAVAENGGTLGILASKALSSREIEFSRWYA